MSNSTTSSGSALSTDLPQSKITSSALTTGPITAAVASSAPTLAITTGGNTYATVAPKVVAPALSITATDPNTTLDGASATIGTGFNASQDVLGIAGQTGSSGTIGTALTWTYSSTTGVLSILGTATIATYQSALQQVTYVNTSQNPSATDWQINFALGTNLANPANGHFYKFVAYTASTTDTSWNAAYTAANASTDTYFGLQGYLATITSASEQSFVASKVQGNGWIGASDAIIPNSPSLNTSPTGNLAAQWSWVDGPEAGTAFWTNGTTGGPGITTGGAAVTGQYANWNVGEPNNSGGTERYAHIIGNLGVGGTAALGTWNDLPDGGGSGAFAPLGYLVEYGGLAGDPTIQITASVTVYVPPANNLRQLDFTGDGKADIFWRDQTTGADVIWGMNGATRISQTALTTVPINWRVEAIADFDGNQKGDVLWRDYNTGDVAVWQMNNTTIANQAVFKGVPLTWKIVGTGDFTGDGKDDILWRDSASGQDVVWAMNGVQRIDQYALPTVADLNWSVSTVGDFNGDGKADILWRNDSTGQNAIWLLNGKAGIATQSFVASAPTGYFTPGTGKFDAGNTSDILWRIVSNGSGVTYDWLINGTTTTNQGQLLGSVPSDWRVVGLGDFNGDGRTELLWRSYSSGGLNAIWNVNGITVVDQNLIPSVSDLDWEVV